LIGFFALTFADAFVRFRSKIWYPSQGLSYLLNHITAGLFGGFLGGSLTGPWIAAYFGNKYYYYLEPKTLLPGAMVGIAVLVFALINYNLEQYRRRKLLTSIATAVGSTLAVGAVVALPYVVFSKGINGYVLHGISALITSDSATTPTIKLLKGGLLYGILVGPMLGAVIGLALPP
jgi:hypothetical protein